MKKLTCFLLLSLVVLVFSNCKKEEVQTNPTYFLMAKINGDDFSSSITTANHIGPFITIVGLNLISNSLSLSVSEDLTPGTYPFSLSNTDEVAGGYGSNLPGGLEVNATSGSLTLTQLDTLEKTLSGTFEFSGTDTSTGDSYDITDGEFNVKYN